jgi:hypothetical protein
MRQSPRKENLSREKEGYRARVPEGMQVGERVREVVRAVRAARLPLNAHVTCQRVPAFGPRAAHSVYNTVIYTGLGDFTFKPLAVYRLQMERRLWVNT